MASRPHVQDSDTALWLHNKLGSPEELWIPSSISGIIKTSTIDNIYRCFPVLTSTIKLKLLLGILHLPRRNLEEVNLSICLLCLFMLCLYYVRFEGFNVIFRQVNITFTDVMWVG